MKIRRIIRIGLLALLAIAATAAAAAGGTVRLVVRHGKQHGWLTMLWDIRRVADWFDEFLLRRDAKGDRRPPPAAGQNPGPAGPVDSGAEVILTRDWGEPGWPVSHIEQ